MTRDEDAQIEKSDFSLQNAERLEVSSVIFPSTLLAGGGGSLIILSSMYTRGTDYPHPSLISSQRRREEKSKPTTGKGRAPLRRE